MESWTRKGMQRFYRHAGGEIKGQRPKARMGPKTHTKLTTEHWEKTAVERLNSD